MPVSISSSAIVAQAFRFMEVSSIAGFGDGSDEATMAAEAYPDALRTCLEWSDWSFASRFESLPQAVLPVVGGADPDFPYFFHLPDGLVRIHELRDSLGDVAWRRDGEGIRADASGPLYVRYTRMIDSERDLPATFKTAVALVMAGLLAPRFGLTNTKLDRMEQMARGRLMTAAAQDGGQASAERYDDQVDSGDWVAGATR